MTRKTSCNPLYGISIVVLYCPYRETYKTEQYLLTIKITLKIKYVACSSKGSQTK